MLFSKAFQRFHWNRHQVTLVANYKSLMFRVTQITRQTTITDVLSCKIECPTQVNRNVERKQVILYPGNDQSSGNRRKKQIDLSICSSTVSGIGLSIQKVLRKVVPRDSQQTKPIDYCLPKPMSRSSIPYL